ncbi:proline-rich protein 36-like, partial [Penaeus monodon]|uniref:proline-rich protein 36-like n=1 Tax=Penaeus monodon TaxID=6687 RepID=UPI0018A73DC8
MFQPLARYSFLTGPKPKSTNQVPPKGHPPHEGVGFLGPPWVKKPPQPPVPGPRSSGGGKAGATAPHTKPNLPLAPPTTFFGWPPTSPHKCPFAFCTRVCSQAPSKTVAFARFGGPTLTPGPPLATIPGAPKFQYDPPHWPLELANKMPPWGPTPPVPCGWHLGKSRIPSGPGKSIGGGLEQAWPPRAHLGLPSQEGPSNSKGGPLAPAPR